ncbi:response regulator transcription factor [Filobacillus milosensis]|uniref:Response regulator transcription factor n=1 Tax=Filobacillus milosensis TaxID=94137 RepID=A0A4Y8IDP7_9BACI|nr:response regulator transcription factor [Filobacillus milosensis]TFB14108.1 response regulator transcription factor [Filobacillus milosensis]
MGNRILIVDDEWNMRNLIKIYLSREAFQLNEAKDGYEAIEMADQYAFDLVVLDVMLPDIDGWEVCSTIRKTSEIPILMLTARDDVKDRVLGLNIGADDYLIKPFAPEELVARVKALLRRRKKDNREIDKLLITFNDLSIDYDSRETWVKGTRVELTPKEFDILYTVAHNPKTVFTRDILLDKIWYSEEFRDLRAVDTHVKNLREKVRKAGLSFNPVKTVWGVGYKFNRPEDQY